ncbi:MAG: hypothetical protein KDA96_11000, partial [Planctomycetaceae bacterium]|nr:hypothetical protein [Planctomycetaceae bacterium]
PALIVPRIRPRREQLIRAERLRDLGWVTVISPDQLQQGMIRRWLETCEVPVPDRQSLNLNGLQSIGDRLMHIRDTRPLMCRAEPGVGSSGERPMKSAVGR